MNRFRAHTLRPLAPLHPLRIHYSLLYSNSSQTVTPHSRASTHGLKLACRIALLLCLSIFLLAGCGDNPTDENVAQAPLREARPTFTPTVASQQANAPAVAAVATEPAQPAGNAEAAPPEAASAAPAAIAEQPTPEATPAVNEKPIVVINDELVNTRNGPGLNFDLVDTVPRGEQFDIVGKTVDGGWWKICCVKQQQVWVVNQFVTTKGNTDSVTVITDIFPEEQAPVAQAPAAVQQPAAANPAPVAQQPTATPVPAPTTPPAPAFAFDLILQEQLPETNVVHVFLFVFEGSNALEGFSLRVTHNGVELPGNGSVSIGPVPGLTWPIADARQRLQNYKVEFPGEQPGGTWVAQLIQNGQPVGPPATFTLKDNDRDREMYVRYQKK